MKKLPKDFFANIPVYNPLTDKKEDDEIIPFEFSEEVMSGKRKITVHLAKWLQGKCK